MRLFFVVQALGFPDVALGISGALFVALIGSLLTAVPLSPAGLGIVELGIVGVLSLAYGVPLTEATTIALVDRVDQRVLDHRLRLDPVLDLGQAEGARASHPVRRRRRRGPAAVVRPAGLDRYCRAERSSHAPPATAPDPPGLPAP